MDGIGTHFSSSKNLAVRTPGVGARFYMLFFSFLHRRIKAKSCAGNVPSLKKAIASAINNPGASVEFPWSDCMNKPSNSMKVVEVGIDITVADATAALVGETGRSLIAL